MEELFEHLNVGFDNYPAAFFGDDWLFQSFTPQESHLITSIKLQMQNFGFPGMITASIRATVDGKPVVPDLCVGTTDGDTLEGREWRKIELGDGYNVESGIMYSIVLRAPTGSESNFIKMEKDPNGEYPRGTAGESSNQGESWSIWGDIDIMFEVWGIRPVITDKQVGANLDDAKAYWNGSAWVIDVAGWEEIVGYGSATAYKYGAGMRFTGLTIPIGSTITKANLQLFSKNWVMGVDTVNSKLRAEQTDEAAAFSTIEDYQGRERITAVVTWNAIGTWEADTWYTSPDIKTLIQELVDDYVGLSDAEIVLFWDDHDNESTQSDNRYRAADNYESSSVHAPKLHIEYHPVIVECTATGSGIGSVIASIIKLIRRVGRIRPKRRIPFTFTINAIGKIVIPINVIQEIVGKRYFKFEEALPIHIILLRKLAESVKTVGKKGINLILGLLEEDE